MSAAGQRQIELAARRERLVALAAIQRAELRMQFATLATPTMGALGSAWSAWRWVRSRPLQVGLPLLALMLWSRRAWHWGNGVWPLLRWLPLVATLLRTWRLGRALAQRRG